MLQGYRVIGLAYRTIDFDPAQLRKDELRRECESHLTFLGLVVMENKLKPESAPTLERLRAANVRPVMVTGDNALTAISVAHEAKLLDPGTEVFVGCVS